MARVARRGMIGAFATLLLAASGAPVTVAPIEDAIPASARSALFLQKFATDLEPAVDAMERILDPLEAEAFIDTAPLPAMALESLQGASSSPATATATRTSTLIAACSRAAWSS